MTFAWPHCFWLMLVPLALLVGDLLRRRQAAKVDHPKILRAEAGAQGLTLVRQAASPHRVRPWLYVGLALTAVALTRPQWGRIEEPVFDQAREILIAIDLSRSMLAQDVKPSRLDRAKLLTQSLLEKLEGERVGLVTFSGTAFLQSPLSSDYEILREFLPALNPDFLPEGGTNYHALIDTSLAAFGTSAAADRFLIILSDGEATDDEWKSSVAELRKKGIRVIGLGVGTAAGAMIPEASGGFVKDERGAVVLSKLESGTLQQLAHETGGTYRDASSWIDLPSILSATVDAGKKGKFVDKMNIRQVERFQWPLAFGLWCLLFSFCYEFPVRPRPRELKFAAKPAPSPVAPGSLPGAAALLLFALASGALAPRTEAAGAPAPAGNAAPAPPPLAKIVARISAQDERSARDWSEFAGETVRWGQAIKGESRPVPPGPVRDALAAVELGQAMDAKLTDWSKLRSDLETLLTPPESKKKDQDQQQNKDQQNQSAQQKDSSDSSKSDQQKQQDQQQKQQDKKDQQDQQQQSSQSKQNPASNSNPQDASQQQPQNQSESPPAKPDPQRKGISAFGDMKDHPPPPPPSHDMQKVGGTQEKKPADQAPTDPQLALPLQKLDQIRNQDSPAQLFQLMDADQKPTPKKKGKDW